VQKETANVSSKPFKLRSFALAVSLILATASTAVPAATLVVANKAEATVSLIDLASGEVVATLPTGDGPHEADVSPDGRRALITNYGVRGKPGNSLTLIDLPGLRVVKTITLEGYSRPHGVEWLDDHRAAVTAEDQRALLVVDVDKGVVEKAIDTAQEVSHMVAPTADGKRAFVANIGSGSVTAVDLEAGERIKNVPTGDGAEGIAVTGDQVWVTNRAADTVTVLDATTLEVLKTMDCEGFPIRAAATPDGAHVLVTRARAGDLAIFSTQNLGEMRRVDLGLKVADTENRLFGDRFGDSSVPIGIVVASDGKRAFVAHANADKITENEIPSGKRLRLLTAGKEPDGMAYSPLEVKKGN